MSLGSLRDSDEVLEDVSVVPGVCMETKKCNTSVMATPCHGNTSFWASGQLWRVLRKMGTQNKMATIYICIESE